MELPRRRPHSDRPDDPETGEGLRVINEFAISMLRQRTLDDLLWDVAQKVGTLLGFDDCVIYIVDGDRLLQLAAYGVKTPGARRIVDPISISIGEGVVGGVAATGRSRIVSDTSKEPDYIRDHFLGMSELAVPICFEGKVIGVIDSECLEKSSYSDADLEMVESIANIAAPRIAFALMDRELGSVQDRLRVANASLEHRIHRCTDELRSALEQVHRAQLLESVGQLAGGVAHDLNNALMAIQGNVSLAQQDAPKVGELSEVLDAAMRSCKKAWELPRRLIALTDGGAPKLSPSRGLGRLVRDCASEALAASNIAAHFDIPERLPEVDFDQVQISQVVNNLLMNSRQAMPSGGAVWISASVRDSDAGESVEFVFRDTGPGVSGQHRDRVFDPYYSTDDGNTGLGLTIAHSVVARHGGDLSLDPPDGEGAIFRMSLPLSRRRSPVKTPRRAPMPGAWILIMDDEPGIRTLLERALTRLGYRVVATSSGDEALIEFHRHVAMEIPFSMVMLDLTVPGGMGGVKTLEALRRFDAEIPAIAMSGYSNDGVLSDAGRFGFQLALAKPFDVDALRASVAQVLGRSVDREAES